MNTTDLSTLAVDDFELEVVALDVETAMAKNCSTTGSCCSCSTTPDLDA
ncbi:hypothetical protein ACLGIH_00960 [Streptomyces sp. HMX87]